MKMKKIKSFIDDIKVKKAAVRVELIKEEEEYLKKYSDIVATKLEEKVIELEKTTVSLQ